MPIAEVKAMGVPISMVGFSELKQTLCFVMNSEIAATFPHSIFNYSKGILNSC